MHFEIFMHITEHAWEEIDLLLIPPCLKCDRHLAVKVDMLPKMLCSAFYVTLCCMRTHCGYGRHLIVWLHKCH